MARRSPAPLWLARPTRWSRLDSGQARVALVLFALLLLACLLALTPRAAPGESNIVFDQAIVEALRHGAGYYAAAAGALREGGYPLHPFTAFPLPALAVIEARLPPVAVAGLLLLVVAGAGVAWHGRLRGALRPGLPQGAALGVVILSLLMFARPSLSASHEIWAGPLIALSLALRHADRWIEAVLVALIALMIHETVLLFVLVMAVLALAEGARREALGWGAAIAVFAAVIVCHAIAAGAAADTLDSGSPGWPGLLGFGFAIRAVALTTPFAVLPLALAAPLIGFALFGWASWASGTGLRGIATLVAYIALLAVAARADAFHWAALIGPIVPLGLLFAPDGLRDLVMRALDRRRITVTRIRP